MKQYNIYIRSDEHPRTINTPIMGRTYYTKISVFGMDALKAKVMELRGAGEVITDIRTNLGTRIWL
jgi:hypothetical protein